MSVARKLYAWDRLLDDQKTYARLRVELAMTFGGYDILMNMVGALQQKRYPNSTAYGLRDYINEYLPMWKPIKNHIGCLAMKTGFLRSIADENVRREVQHQYEQILVLENSHETDDDSVVDRIHRAVCSLDDYAALTETSVFNKAGRVDQQLTPEQQKMFDELNKREKRQCSHCKKKGHTVDYCYLLKSQEKA
mgnify:CR=1 FL=1